MGADRDWKLPGMAAWNFCVLYEAGMTVVCYWGVRLSLRRMWSRRCEEGLSGKKNGINWDQWIKYQNRPALRGCSALVKYIAYCFIIMNRWADVDFPQITGVGICYCLSLGMGSRKGGVSTLSSCKPLSCHCHHHLGFSQNVYFIYSPASCPTRLALKAR